MYELCIKYRLCDLGGSSHDRVGNKFKLPDVTSYLVAGLLLEPCLLGVLNIPGLGFHSFADVEVLPPPFNDVALGFIAFEIGSEFRLSHLKKKTAMQQSLSVFSRPALPPWWWTPFCLGFT